MDYYDEYDYMLDEDVADYDANYVPSPESSAYLETNCIQSSVTQIVSYLLALLGVNLLYLLVWRLFTRRTSLQHVTSVVCGFALLYFATGHDFLIVLFLSLIAYALMLVLQYFKFHSLGLTVSVLTIMSHFTYEILWDQPESWHRIRGMQMVATMKIISLAFDYESYTHGRKLKSDEEIRLKKQYNINSLSLPSLIPYLGYIFCPANCLLGPWISYAEYTRSLQVCNKSVKRLMLSSALNAILAIIFLCLSNCIVPLLCMDNAWKWIRTYRDALAVRCSHYFICFLSQSTMAAAGLVPTPKVPSLNITFVTKPLHIELPRSLSAAVRVWNIPMHEWLKHYVFRSLHKRFGHKYLVSILCTYLVSSLLHGIHLRIYVVLLSLACFAYVEVVLRRKLAHIFDACMMAQACMEPCPFRHCPSHGWRSIGAIVTALVNFVFSLLAILHLAYLGIMMAAENDNDIFVKSESLHLIKWLNMNYLSHWIALAMYLFYLVV